MIVLYNSARPRVRVEIKQVQTHTEVVPTEQRYTVWSGYTQRYKWYLSKYDSAPHAAWHRDTQSEALQFAHLLSSLINSTETIMVRCPVVASPGQLPH